MEAQGWYGHKEEALMTDHKAIEVPAGALSYVDRGHGRPVVFVHGNPSSAEEFVPAMAALGEGVRCVAPDHIGFGHSSKPPGWDYLPASHASNLAVLLDQLDLHDATVVVGDWGGPIGLSWVLDHPGRVARVVITNTWLWPVDRSLYYQAFSKMMGGPLGRWATRNHNAFARLIVRGAWGRATPLTRELHASFTSVHSTPDERNGMWVFPRRSPAPRPGWPDYGRDGASCTTSTCRSCGVYATSRSGLTSWTAGRPSSPRPTSTGWPMWATSPRSRRPIVWSRPSAGRSRARAHSMRKMSSGPMKAIAHAV